MVLNLMDLRGLDMGKLWVHNSCWLNDCGSFLISPTHYGTRSLETIMGFSILNRAKVWLLTLLQTHGKLSLKNFLSFPK